MARRPGRGEDDEPHGHRRPGEGLRRRQAARLPGDLDGVRLRERPARVCALRARRGIEGLRRGAAAQREKDREGQCGRGPASDGGGTMISLLAALLMSLQTFPPKLPDGKESVTDTSE